MNYKKLTTASLSLIAGLGLYAQSAHAKNVTVKSGDSLSQIAIKNHTSLATILKLNNLKTNSIIKIGDKIKISNEPKKIKKQNKITSVTVKSGDSLSSIANKYKTTIQSIMQLNNIKNANSIQIGQILKLKGATTSAIKTKNKTKTVAALNLSETIPESKSDAIRKKATNLALKYLGTPYVWGASSPTAFDCSGLVSYVYGQYGISIPHQSGAQANFTTRIATKNAKKGDLLFWTNSSGRVFHVAISLGNGHYVDALDENHGTVIDGMAKPADFAGRVPIK